MRVAQFSPISYIAAIIMSVLLQPEVSVAQFAGDEGTEEDSPSSEYYDLSVGTQRYFDVCGSVTYICAGNAWYKAVESVVDHERIEDTTYAVVEWRYEAKENATDPNTEVINKTETFYFRMKESELWVLDKDYGNETKAYDFGFQPGDSLQNFIEKVESWNGPFNYGSSIEDFTILPETVTSDTTIQTGDKEYATIWASEEFEEGDEIPVLKALVEDNGGEFNENYPDLYYYVRGMGVWHNPYTHWGIPMVGVDIGEESYGRSVTVTSAANEPEEVPEQPELKQNYPNPFNASTIISYELPETMEVRLRVYDRSGKEIGTLINGKKSSGLHTIEFDGNQLASGIYIYRLETPLKTEEIKMILIK